MIMMKLIIFVLCSMPFLARSTEENLVQTHRTTTKLMEYAYDAEGAKEEGAKEDGDAKEEDLKKGKDAKEGGDAKEGEDAEEGEGEEETTDASAANEEEGAAPMDEETLINSIAIPEILGICNVVTVEKDITKEMCAGEWEKKKDDEKKKEKKEGEEEEGKEKKEEKEGEEEKKDDKKEAKEARFLGVNTFLRNMHASLMRFKQTTMNFLKADGKKDEEKKTEGAKGEEKKDEKKKDEEKKDEKKKDETGTCTTNEKTMDITKENCDITKKNLKRKDHILSITTNWTEKVDDTAERAIFEVPGAPGSGRPDGPAIKPQPAIEKIPPEIIAMLKRAQEAIPSASEEQAPEDEEKKDEKKEDEEKKDEKKEDEKKDDEKKEEGKETDEEKKDEKKAARFRFRRMPSLSMTSHHRVLHPKRRVLCDNDDGTPDPECGGGKSGKR